MWVITRKGRLVQEQILDSIIGEAYPISTRQICLKLGYSWHTIQQYCLELLVKKRINRLEVAGTHLWVPNNFLKKRVHKKNTEQSQEEILRAIILNKALDADLNAEIRREIEKLLAKFSKEWREHEKRTEERVENRNKENEETLEK